jgi:hypothetical protein
MLYMSKCQKLLEWRSKIGGQNVNLNWFKLVFLGIINIDFETSIFLHSCEFRVTWVEHFVKFVVVATKRQTQQPFIRFMRKIISIQD